MLRIFQEKQQNYNRYRNASTALKNCILNSVDDEYIKTLKKKITWYTIVNPLELSIHLWDTYGEVTIVDLKANEAQMKMQWNPPSLIESLFLQLEEGQSFAAEGNEKNDNSILVWLGYDNIIETGQFTKYYAKWRKRPITDQKRATFRQCFTEFDKERSNCMTTDEPTYNINQVQEMSRTGIQSEMAAWCQAITDENSDPNIPTSSLHPRNLQMPSLIPI